MTLLIDTNVALDFLLNRAPWADDAQRVFELALETGQTISVTANAVTDIYYIARRQLQSGAEARRILERVLSVFDVLDVTGRDCRNALADEMPDYEDAMRRGCRRALYHYQGHTPLRGLSSAASHARSVY